MILYTCVLQIRELIKLYIHYISEIMTRFADYDILYDTTVRCMIYIIILYIGFLLHVEIYKPRLVKLALIIFVLL